jgi:hypothetical protein
MKRTKARTMRRVLASAGIVVLTALSSMAFAGHHLNGTWKLNVSIAGQAPGTATFELTEGEGGELTGTYAGAAGSANVTGMVSGADVEFSFDSQAGKVTYKGSYADGKLSGTCSYGMIGDGTFEGGKS